MDTSNPRPTFDMADRLTEEQIAVFKEAFSHCDKDGDGIITAKEFSSLVGQMLVELRRQPTTEIQNALNQLEAMRAGKERTYSQPFVPMDDEGEDDIAGEEDVDM